MNNTTCGDINGSFTANASGGIPPYKVVYSFENTAEQTVNFPNGDNSVEVNFLASGNYQVTITDSYNCSVFETIAIGSSTDLQADIFDFQYVTCGLDNGFAEVSITAGVPPFTYLWSNGANTARIENLSPGQYDVTITDGGGCQNENGIFIELNSEAIVIELDDLVNTTLWSRQWVYSSPGN